MNFSKRTIETNHQDYIHDIAYDFYGRRLATCSSDQKIKFWQKDQNGEWEKKNEIEGGHSASVLRVEWAHPEFGSVVASCSSDRNVHIHEEFVDVGTNKKSWSLRASLTDSRTTVRDVKFAPRHHGLKLAAGSEDGVVRIYEASDLMNLNSWSIWQKIGDEKNRKKVNSISWNPSPFDPPMLAIARDSSVTIWEYIDSKRTWENMGEIDHGNENIVNDVAWAPNMGRSFHLIATACSDGIVRIYKFSSNRSKIRDNLKNHITVEDFDDHKKEVWRVSWNITGTCLASSGDDRTVRLWAPNLAGKFKAVVVLNDNEKGKQDISSMVNRNNLGPMFDEFKE